MKRRRRLIASNATSQKPIKNYSVSAGKRHSPGRSLNAKLEARRLVAKRTARTARCDGAVLRFLKSSGRFGRREASSLGVNLICSHRVFVPRQTGAGNSGHMQEAIPDFVRHL